MINTGKLAGKTAFITGASRGIGKAIAIKLAKDGCNIALAAKTTEPHPKLEGTIFTVAKEVEENGGHCLPLKVDVRFEDNVRDAINKTVNTYGGLDILINNASAISLIPTQATDMKRYDLMHQVNVRATFMVSKYAIEHLMKSSHPHILNISPPLIMEPHWFQNHLAYTMSKYGMSLCVLGMAEELKDYNIAVNALWPRITIWTAAMQMLVGESARDFSRKPEIMSDAAYSILLRDPSTTTGNFFIDEDVIRSEGITDLDQYSIKPGNMLYADFFLPKEYMKDTISFESKSKVTSNTDKIFSSVKSMMNETLKNEINASLLFVVSGKNYFLDCHGSRPFQIIEAVDQNHSPDVTISVDDDTFYKMAKGEIKAANAFLAGKLKIKGNMVIAMKLEKLFGKLRAKL